MTGASVHIIRPAAGCAHAYVRVCGSGVVLAGLLASVWVE